ncbi:hypothetical protein ACFOOP_03760 [Marinicaulis aureus]|uniref:Uncharacterized protein n=1 Tax=Hyphococcus aureus TaxID=2666033 RepID=A0ABW1KSS5_9PROT
MKKLFAAALFSIAPFAANANEVENHCAAYANDHHGDASVCHCLAEAADAHHELEAKIEKIHSVADYEHADDDVKHAVAACFHSGH